MNIVLLSGGSGKRLWPLSNAVRSKQFIKFLRGEDGKYESMVQRVYRQIRTADPQANVTITTGRIQKSAVLNQLSGEIQLCIEPSRRDTFAAIALSVVFACDQQKLKPDDVMIFCPIDPYADTDYFHALLSLEKCVQTGESNITLMGVIPTYASEKYGYILPEKSGEGQARKVLAFYEKPNAQKAEEYIARGALWNCGVFAFKVSYLMSVLKHYTKYTTYEELYEHYDELPKISFDYAVVEQEQSIQCITYRGSWKDIGTWNTLAEEMTPDTIGDVIVTDDCEGVNVINEMDVPVLVAGLSNIVVAASLDGILVSDKTASSFIKPYVDALDRRVMYKEKTWGELKIISMEAASITLKLHVKALHSIQYHSHQLRSEVWVILAGEGHVRVGDEIYPIVAGQTVELPAGIRHSIYAATDMQLLEIQMGELLDADIEKA